MAEKRKRSQNYTSEEKERLVRMLLEKRETILNKKTDGSTNEAKALAWQQLTDSFNREGSIYRSKESLMKMWEKLKSESKSYYTASRRDTTQTGGGPSVVKLDPLMEQICSILGRGCTGIIGVQDSDFVAESTPNNNNEITENLPKVVVLNIEDNIPLECNIEESAYRDTEVNHEEVIRKTPLWSRRRPVRSQINERTEAVSLLCNSFKEVNKKKEDIEDLKRQLIQEEIDFKRKLYELQLQSAQKEVEIKNEVLRQIRGGDMQYANLYGFQQKKTE